MDRIPKIALMSKLIEQLEARGSWCGETHIQKATYFLQELASIQLFNFILYKHGPFSFDLRDELASMRADGLLEMVPKLPYGPSWRSTPVAEGIRNHYPKTLGRYADAIEFVALALGPKTVGELERLATALWVTREDAAGSDNWASRINQIKPHVSIEAACSALQELHTLEREAREYPLLGRCAAGAA